MDHGSDLRPSVVNWNGQDVREETRFQCRESQPPKRSKRNHEVSGQAHKHRHRTAASPSPSASPWALVGSPSTLTHHSLDEPMGTRHVLCRPPAIVHTKLCSPKHGAGDTQSLGQKSRQEGTGQLHSSCFCPQVPSSVTWPLLSRGQPWTSSCPWAQ